MTSRHARKISAMPAGKRIWTRLVAGRMPRVRKQAISMFNCGYGSSVSGYNQTS